MRLFCFRSSRSRRRGGERPFGDGCNFLSQEKSRNQLNLHHFCRSSSSYIKYLTLVVLPATHLLYPPCTNLYLPARPLSPSAWLRLGLYLLFLLPTSDHVNVICSCPLRASSGAAALSPPHHFSLRVSHCFHLIFNTMLVLDNSL